jgi:predicted transcriptional regulator
MQMKATNADKELRKPVTYRIPERLRDRLQAEAKGTHRTQTAIIEMALEQFLGKKRVA